MNRITLIVYDDMMMNHAVRDWLQDGFDVISTSEYLMDHVVLLGITCSEAEVLSLEDLETFCEVGSSEEKYYKKYVEPLVILLQTSSAEYASRYTRSDPLYSGMYARIEADIHREKPKITGDALDGMLNIERLSKLLLHDYLKLNYATSNDIGICWKTDCCKFMHPHKNCKAYGTKFKSANKIRTLLTQTRYYKVIQVIDNLLGMLYKSKSELKYRFSGLVEDDTFYSFLDAFIINKNFNNGGLSYV